MDKQIRVGILGATGYAGVELARLIASHPFAKLTYIVSHSYVGQKLSDVYPHLKNVVDLTCEELDVQTAKERCDVVFTALPHGASKEVIPALYESGVKIIDLSGDFRYNDIKVYEQWYKQEHTAPELLKKSVYGLPELHREEIKNATLIGNPGCYTTCSILGLAPLLAAGICDTENIIIDAKSGVSGAGRGLGIDYHFCECTENMKAYKLATHRHTSEIEQELSLVAGKDIMLSFSPHLVPMKRGIFATSYANLKQPISHSEVVSLYQKFYDGEPFVRIYESGLPESNHVAGSNFVDIGFCIDERLNRIIIVSTIDNLFKGAAGQAVQNMNLLFGLDETAGICGSGYYL